MTGVLGGGGSYDCSLAVVVFRKRHCTCLQQLLRHRRAAVLCCPVQRRPACHGDASSERANISITCGRGSLLPTPRGTRMGLLRHPPCGRGYEAPPHQHLRVSKKRSGWERSLATTVRCKDRGARVQQRFHHEIRIVPRRLSRGEEKGWGRDDKLISVTIEMQGQQQLGKCVGGRERERGRGRGRACVCARVRARVSAFACACA